MYVDLVVDKIGSVILGLVKKSNSLLSTSICAVLLFLLFGSIFLGEDRQLIRRIWFSRFRSFDRRDVYKGCFGGFLCTSIPGFFYRFYFGIRLISGVGGVRFFQDHGFFRIYSTKSNAAEF